MTNLSRIKRIDTVWTILTVEPNGQEQLCRFLDQPVIMPDERKLPLLHQIADVLAANHHGEFRIVKFSMREDIKVVRRQQP